MQADTVKLTQLFRKDIRYVVPTFQRPYVWNEEDHWQLLWDDLTAVMEELLDRRARAEEKGTDKSEETAAPHFLGALVLDQLANPTGKLETRRVIDGQQRLTTLQVLLSATCSVAEELSLDDRASLAEKLMFNDVDLIDEEEHRLKVWPIDPDQEAFKRVMMPDGDSERASRGDGSHLIEKCFQFFHDEVESWANEGPQSPGERIDAIVDTLWSLVRLVAIDLEQRDDPQVIFETLNARGTPLLAADLIKNYILRKAEDEGEPVDTLHSFYWKQFDEEYWRTEVSQGRLERPRIDVFVMHWLTMHLAEQVRAQQLFPTFRTFMDRNQLGAEAVLKDIHHYSGTYQDLSPETQLGRESLFFHRLEVMDTTTPYPVLLWMYGNEDLEPRVRRKAVEAVESWLMRRMLCRMTSKNYNKIFLELVATLKESDLHRLDAEVIGYFREKDGTSDLWPTDERLTEVMKTERYWAQINQRRLRMFFKALERELRSTGYSESLGVTEKLHIEHLMPQDWALHWDLPGEAPVEVERIRREDLIHTVGNLTVLTDKLNPSLSNAPWEEKREAIEDHSVLLLNREIVKHWYEEWNEETIKKRSERLAALASAVWPGPESEYWDE